MTDEAALDMPRRSGLIPAATILLLRESPGLEVLMIERHADIGFAGGALVFPGGKIEAGDAAPGWGAHCDGLDAVAPAERAPRIAAIREAFEETGILIARDDRGRMIDDAATAALSPLRPAIEKNDALFLDMIADHELCLACDALRLFARWQPPRAVTHKRYHTWFFAAAAPADQTAREDGNEATEALWTTPSAAMAACAGGARKMIFPTARNVELLALSDTVDAVFANAAARPIEPVEPKVEERGGQAVLTIPDHLGYPVTSEPLERAFRS